MDRITQALVSPELRYFEDRFRQRFALGRYVSRRSPVIVFGCYLQNREWLRKLYKHRGIMVIVWGGSDALYMRNAPSIARKLRGMPNARHIAISNFIRRDLEVLEFNHRYFPICPTLPNLFRPVLRGSHVLIYDPPKKRKRYGVPMAYRVMEKFPELQVMRVASTGRRAVSYPDMINIYSQCFMGLRLTEHDGLSNTVVELGLCGCRCVWNGGAPNAIEWKTEEDVIAAVKTEKEVIGTYNRDVAAQMVKFIDVGDGWLDADLYR